MTVIGLNVVPQVFDRISAFAKLGSPFWFLRIESSSLASKLRGDVVNLQKVLQDHLERVNNEYASPQDDEKIPTKPSTKATAEALAELKEATTLKSDISHCSAVIILPASQWNMISTIREDLEAMTEKLISSHEKMEEELKMKDVQIETLENTMQSLLMDLSERRAELDYTKEALEIGENQLEMMVRSEYDEERGDEESGDF
ncbi:hypothetical protein ACHAWF_005851 [Thalassiosira exigua]